MLKLLHATTLLLLSITASTILADEEVCFEGYVMDKFCIDRGTLLDNNRVRTLEEPERHSVHCLVDVKVCRESGFNILILNPNGGSPKYARAFKLDGTGNEEVLALARATGRPGSCSTCSGSGRLTHGFRATFFGKIIKSTDSNEPDTFATTRVETSPRLFDSSAESDGCPKNSTVQQVRAVTTGENSLKKPQFAHGSLMIIGWGFLLPTGVISALFLRHRPNALWFKVHRIMQIFGLIVAIAGWAVALDYFDVFSTTGTRSYKHGILGMITMILGILQPINALVRPHPPVKGESRPLKRLIWEIVHKCSGYAAIILAAVTIYYGTTLLFIDYEKKFRAAWIATLAWNFVFGLACVLDGYLFNQRQRDVNIGKAEFHKNAS